MEWDSQTGENVLWKAPAGGLGHSTPVVWGDTVFLTTSSSQEAEEKGKVMPEHHVIAFRTRDGKQLWRTPITPGTSLCQWHEYAAPTPVTDGKALYVWFASGVAAAVDFEGKLIWREQRNEVSIVSDILNPVSPSPVLFGNTVIIKCHQSDADQQGMLQALDKTTGKVTWERRLAKPASLSSPILIEANGKKQLVVASPGIVEGFNPADGTQIWSVSTKRGNEAASPVYDRDTGLVLASGGPVAINPKGIGDITASNVRTSFKDYSSGMYSSPVISAGHVFCNPEFKHELRCWNWETGEPVISEKIKEMPDYVCGIATADGLLYYVSAGFSVIVPRQGRSWSSWRSTIWAAAIHNAEPPPPFPTEGSMSVITISCTASGGRNPDDDEEEIDEIIMENAFVFHRLDKIRHLAIN